MKCAKAETWALRPAAVEVRPGNCRLLVVRGHEIRRTALRILMKLGMKLKDDKVRKLTRPDFPGKFLFINYS